MAKTLAQLPTDTVHALQAYRETDKDKFFELVHALRGAGWPLRAIAEPLGVTRASAKNWADKAEEYVKSRNEVSTLNVDIPAVPLTTHGQSYRPVRIKPDIPPSEVEKMRELADKAKQVTRWTPAGHPDRQAGAKLEELILFYTQQRKVPIAVVARHLGVTRRAVAQRIEKYKEDKR